MILILLGLLLNTAFAEPSVCKGIDMPVDSFTGMVQQNASVMVNDNRALIPWFFRIDQGHMVVTIRVAASGVRDEIFPAGYTIPVMMKDESIVVLTAPNESRPVGAATVDGVFTNWMVEFPMDRHTLDLLTAQPIIAMRVEKPTGVTTFNISSAWAKQLNRVLACFGSYVTDTPAPAAPPAEGDPVKI